MTQNGCKMKPYLLLLISSIFLACGKTHKLSSSDLAFNPYKKGDKLIFQSNNSVFDTVVVTEIVRVTHGLGYPFDGNRDKAQGLSVVVNHLVSNPDSFPGRPRGSIFMIHNY